MANAPRDYQIAAITQWHAAIASGGTRASLILPTGTGKTVVAAHLLPEGDRIRVAFFVPTVVLLQQTCRRLLQVRPDLHIVRVCSRTATDITNDPTSAYTEDQVAGRAHIDVTTDPDTIAQALQLERPVAIIATYASSPAVAEAATATGTTFDLSICDEAHRTAGAPTKAWALPVRDEFPARHRLFATATARTITVPDTPAATAAMTEIGWDSADVISMDAPEIYGPHINTLTFREAIDQNYLSDYEIALIGITSYAARTQLHTLINSANSDYTIADAAAHLALARATQTHPRLRSVLAFHNRIQASRTWTARLPEVHNRINPHMRRELIALHIDGETPTEERENALAALETPGENLCVVSNCRVFAEGVDVPALDAVLFAAPRTAGPDIVQIIGRAIRPHPGGTDHKALVIVPVLLANDSDDTAADIAAARTSHLAAWRVLTSLADQDELLHQSLLTWREKNDTTDTPRSGPLSIDIPEGLDSLARDFFLRTIDRTIPTHLRTAAYLADFQATYGHTNVRTDKHFRGFPLGTALRAARAAYRTRSMTPRIIAQFEAIPGFAWKTRDTAPQRTADQWIDLIEHYVTKTKIHAIDRSAFVTDPATGTPAKIGHWYHTKGMRKNYLTGSERNRLNRIINTN